jgi:hypothetical protein
MKNAKTTICAIVAAAAGFVMFSPDLFAHYPVVLAVAKYIMVGGLAGLGLAAKDSTSHSTVAEVENETAKDAAKQ